MLDWLKAAWASWRVRVAVVGGTLVVATAYGTCSFDPQTVSEAEVVPVSGTVTTETVEAVDETTTETETTETTETTATE
tara:strand:+ start:27 stop:263 length:237 start_codon:yes stop_codon:yes gene_type:complete